MSSLPQHSVRIAPELFQTRNTSPLRGLVLGLGEGPDCPDHYDMALSSCLHATESHATNSKFVGVPLYNIPVSIWMCCSRLLCLYHPGSILPPLIPGPRRPSDSFPCSLQCTKGQSDALSGADSSFSSGTLLVTLSQGN